MIDISRMRIDTDMRFLQKFRNVISFPNQQSLIRSKEMQCKKIFLPQKIKKLLFLKRTLAKNCQKNDATMKKNRFLNYKICFTTFGRILALYDHFWVTYAKNLKKTPEICSFSRNFDR